MPVLINQQNWTIEPSSCFPPEVRQERVAFYLKTGSEEPYSTYLMYFVNDIRSGQITNLLVSITRKVSRKLDID